MYMCDSELHCWLMDLLDGLRTCFNAAEKIRFLQCKLNKKKIMSVLLIGVILHFAKSVRCSRRLLDHLYTFLSELFQI